MLEGMRMPSGAVILRTDFEPSSFHVATLQGWFPIRILESSGLSKPPNAHVMVLLHFVTYYKYTGVGETEV